MTYNISYDVSKDQKQGDIDYGSILFCRLLLYKNISNFGIEKINLSIQYT